MILGDVNQCIFHCLILYKLYFQVTQSEAGTGKFGSRTTDQAWEDPDISGRDIGQVCLNLNSGTAVLPINSTS